MPIHERVYRRLENKFERPLPWAPLTMAHYGARYATKGWFTKLLIFGSFVPLIVMSFMIYAASTQQEFMLSFLRTFTGGTFNASSYETIAKEHWVALGKGILTMAMVVQGLIGMALTPLVGSRVIADDLRTQAFEVYFSGPMSAWHYALGKLLVVLRPLAFITVVPSVLILVVSSLLIPSTAVPFLQLYPLAILAGLLMALVNASVIIGISSLGKSRRYATVAWLMLAVGSWVVQAVVFGQMGPKGPEVIGYQANVWVLCQAIIDFKAPEQMIEAFPFLSPDRGVWPPALVVASMMALSIGLVMRRAHRGSLS